MSDPRIAFQEFMTKHHGTQSLEMSEDGAEYLWLYANDSWDAWCAALEYARATEDKHERVLFNNPEFNRLFSEWRELKHDIEVAERSINLSLSIISEQQDQLKEDKERLSSLAVRAHSSVMKELDT